ncbi:MAG: bacterioferritin, partial [Ketobacter sp.]|nr:bacterioferritin [Ketobacter sp.]
DFALEKKAIPELRQVIAHADELKDYGTVELLSEILVSEEGHYLWLEQQLRVFDQVGAENYLQSQL